MTEIENFRIIRADNMDLVKKVRDIRDAVFIREQNVPHDREFDDFEEDSIHFLAEIDGEPVGCVRYRSFRNLAKIERLAVMKQHRGKGIGKALMDHVETRAMSIEPKGFILNSQVTAIPFYNACGYRARGPVFLDAGIDHREMTKEI